MEAIVAAGLIKRYGGFTALRGISFAVRDGEFFGFLGPNGAGKTTTVRVFTGIITPDGGRVMVAGHDVVREPIAAKQSLGVVPEMANVYIDLTAWENLMLMGELYGVPRRDRRRRAQELLGEFRLWERRNNQARTFSKGMRQRLLLAMALVNAPRVLFLDEPTSGLDVQSARMIREKLRHLHERGATIFLTTHNLDEANQLCQRVAIINHGNIVAIDSPDTIRRTASTVRTVEARFRGKVTREVAAQVTGAQGYSVDGNSVRFHTDNPDRVIKQLVEIATATDLEIMELNTIAPKLEDVFIKLTAGTAEGETQ